jgi:hypothetical protein
MHADMTDNEAMMTVTLTIPTQLVQKHAEKILPGNGISITNFNILPKTVYDRGDCDRIISLNETSIVEKVPTVCSEYRFVPDTTINQLAESNDIYPIGTIGAVVTLARKVGSQHILHIKDGESDNDKAMVPFSIPNFVLYFHMLIYLSYLTQLLHCSMLQLQLFDTYSNLFSSMEQQLHKGKFPLMLFKNITKKRDVKERIFRTTQATFVTELRTDIVQDLKKLTSSTTVVRIHLQFHPHFAHKNCLKQFCAAFLLYTYILYCSIY